MAEIKASPQNEFLGGLAGLLSSGKKTLNRVDLPVLGGLGDLMLGQAPELVEDVSYQGMGALVKGGNAATGGIGTRTLDPRIMDAVAVGLGVPGGAKGLLEGAKITGRALSPQLEKAVMDYAVKMGGIKYALMDTNGLPNKGRDLIQNTAEDFAGQLRNKNFVVDLEHSGSAAGPSSYLRISDPETGRNFVDPVRVSGHSKGPFNSQMVRNIGSQEEFNIILKEADELRNLGPVEALKKQKEIDELANILVSQGLKPRAAYKQAQKAITEKN